MSSTFSRYNISTPKTNVGTGSQSEVPAHLNDYPQWLRGQSISNRSSESLAISCKLGSAEERLLAQLLHEHLDRGPISLKVAPTLNKPEAIYEADVTLGGRKVTIYAHVAVNARREFELKELRTNNSLGGKLGSVTFTHDMPSNPSNAASPTMHAYSHLPQGSPVRSSSLIHPNLHQVELDRRENDVGATQRESSWAVKMLQTISPSQTELFLTHIFRLINTTISYKQSYNDLLRRTPGMDAANIAAEMARFGHANALAESINQGIQQREPATKLIKRLLETFEFKLMLDLTGSLLELTDNRVSGAIRAQSFYTDRGRTLLRGDQVRDSSCINRHAGIADELHRRPSTENFFDQEIFHAKSDYTRDASSQTIRQFSKSGVPFIGGASGSLQFIIHALETEKPHSQRTPIERAEVESLLLTHSAIMVAGGHHSIVETILPGRSLGYFGDLPDPLRSENGYKDFIRALDARLDALNLNRGVLLSPNG